MDIEDLLDKIKSYYSAQRFSEIEYKRLAEKATNVYLKVFYGKMSDDERRHQEILSHIFESYYPDEKDALLDIKPSVPLQPERVKYSTDIEEIFFRMKWHIQLEAQAMRDYRKMAETADTKIREWSNLLSDEIKHHDGIVLLMEAFAKEYKGILKGALEKPE